MCLFSLVVTRQHVKGFFSRLPSTQCYRHRDDANAVGGDPSFRLRWLARVPSYNTANRKTRGMVMLWTTYPNKGESEASFLPFLSVTLVWRTLWVNHVTRPCVRGNFFNDFVLTSLMFRPSMPSSRPVNSAHYYESVLSRKS